MLTASAVGNWLYHYTGSAGTGSWYGFFSGFGANFGELMIFGGLVSMYRKHSCHTTGCWRIARHPVAGTPYVVCRKHHPDIPDEITVEHIANAHADASEMAR